MKYTKNLRLPIFDNPSEDKFNISNWNEGNENIDEAYGGLKEWSDNLPLVSADAEIIDARCGEKTLGDKVRKVSTQLDDIETELNNSLDEINKKINYVTLEMFGAIGDGVTDDTTSFVNASNYAINNKLDLVILNKTYCLNGEITLNLNQQGFNIRGTNRNFSILKFGENATLIYPKFYRCNIFDLNFQGNANSNTPLLQLKSLAHLSNVKRCSFQGSKQLVKCDGCAYVTFDECNFNTGGHSGIAQDYLLKLSGEYAYIKNCYFDDFDKQLGNIGLYLDNLNMSFVENSDFCNFYRGTSLLLKPSSSNGVKNITFTNCAFMRNQCHIRLYSNFYIGNIEFCGCKVFMDNSEVTGEQVIVSLRDNGTSGIIQNILGCIQLDGYIDELQNSFIFGTFTFNSRIKLNSHLINKTTGKNALIKYSNVDASIIEPVFNLGGKLVINGTDKKIFQFTILENSPYTNANIPQNILIHNYNGNPTTFKTYLTNTTGGNLVLNCEYDVALATTYVEFVYKVW